MRLTSIRQFELLQSGSLAAITMDGSLLISGDDGEPAFPLSADEPVRWLLPFASGVLYATESGLTAYWDADRQRIELGAADRVLHDGQTVIGVRQNQVLAWDSDMRASILLDDTRPYRYVYLEELLLAEKQIQLQDIEGDWLAEDGHKLVIERSGVSRGYLVFDEGEPLPFYVVYAAHDRMKLMIADLTHRSVDVSLQADGRLHLAASDGMSKVYLRGGQDADAPERL